MWEKQERAEAAQRLADDPDLTAFLNEMTEAAQADFLSARGDPDKMADAWRKAEAADTLRTHLQSALTDQKLAAKKERQRAGRARTSRSK